MAMQLFHHNWIIAFSFYHFQLIFFLFSFSLCVRWLNLPFICSAILTIVDCRVNFDQHKLRTWTNGLAKKVKWNDKERAKKEHIEMNNRKIKFEMMVEWSETTV